MSLDTTYQLQPISRELRLRSRDHQVDALVTDAATMRIDVSASLGPDFGDQLAAPLGIFFIPRREISDDQFVYITHIIISFEIASSEFRLVTKVVSGKVLRSHVD